MVKIVTVCKQGLVRSVALADVLKLHFEPVDVIPVGLSSNSKETQDMLFKWADEIIVMEEKYAQKIISTFVNVKKVYVCEVGPDIYGNSHNRQLIDFCWDWCRMSKEDLGIKEHANEI